MIVMMEQIIGLFIILLSVIILIDNNTEENENMYEDMKSALNDFFPKRFKKYRKIIAGIFLIGAILYGGYITFGETIKEWWISQNEIAVYVADDVNEGMSGQNVVFWDTEKQKFELMMVDFKTPVYIKTNRKNSIEKMYIWFPDSNGGVNRVSVNESNEVGREYVDDSFGNMNQHKTKIFLKKNPEQEVVDASKESTFERLTFEDCRKLKAFYLGLVPYIADDTSVFHSELGYYFIEIDDVYGRVHLYLLTYVWIDDNLSADNDHYYYQINNALDFDDMVIDDVMTDNIESIVGNPSIQQLLIEETAHPNYSNYLGQFIDVTTLKVNDDALLSLKEKIHNNINEIVGDI